MCLPLANALRGAAPAAKIEAKIKTLPELAPVEGGSSGQSQFRDLLGVFVLWSMLHVWARVGSPQLFCITFCQDSTLGAPPVLFVKCHELHRKTQECTY